MRDQDHAFHLKPSPRLTVLLILLAVTSAVLVIFLPLPAWLDLLVFLSASAYGVLLIRQFGLLRGGKAVTCLRRLPDGRWLVSMAKREYEAELCGDSTVTTLASILRFRMPGPSFWTKACVIMPDSLPAGQYRQLLVTLKMY